MTIDKVSKKVVSVFFSDNEKYPKEVYVYGMNLILSSTITTVLLLTVGLSIGRLIETVLFIISFSFLRIFTGGLHSKSYIMCNIYTIILYVSVICFYIFFIDIFDELLIYCPVLLGSFILAKRLAPVENGQKPIRKEIFLCLKRKSQIVVVVESVLLLLANLLGYSKMRIIFPVILLNDVLMIIGFLKNHERRKSNERMERYD